MKSWGRGLASEYRKERESLKAMLLKLDSEVLEDKEDIRVVNSMIREMDFTIKWLETGEMPVKKAREVLYDPDFLGQLDDYAAVDRKIDAEIETERKVTKLAKSTRTN